MAAHERSEFFFLWDALAADTLNDAFRYQCTIGRRIVLTQALALCASRGKDTWLRRALTDSLVRFADFAENDGAHVSQWLLHGRRNRIEHDWIAAPSSLPPSLPSPPSASAARACWICAACSTSTERRRQEILRRLEAGDGPELLLSLLGLAVVSVAGGQLIGAMASAVDLGAMASAVR